MSDGIYYNQEVTTETLNEIAIDLGATSFNGFTTNKFGADELNKITAELVGKGVLLSGEMCRPIVSNGLLYISSGTIVFSNGAKKILTESVNVPFEANTCIYALNDIAAGVCSIVSDTVFPSVGDYVKLAKIDENNNVIDARDIAVGKTASIEGVFDEDFSASFEKVLITNKLVSADDKYYESEYGIKYIPQNPMCRYLLLTVTSHQNSTPFPSYVELSSETQQIMLVPDKSNLSNFLNVRKVGDEVQMYVWQYGAATLPAEITGKLV